jgi:hypothetical protein
MPRLIDANQTKLLGLVVLCASLCLTVLLPAMGIHEFRLQGWVSNPPNPSDPDSIIQSEKPLSVHVWLPLSISAMVGLALWLMSNAPEPRITRRRRSR